MSIIPIGVPVGSAECGDDSVIGGSLGVARDVRSVRQGGVEDRLASAVVFVVELATTTV